MVELQKIGEEAFGVAAQGIIEQCKYAKMPPHMRKLTNQAHFEKDTYDQIVSLLGVQLKLNGLEVSDEWQIIIVTQQASKQNPEKPKPTNHQSSALSGYVVGPECVGENEEPARSSRERTRKSLALFLGKA